MDMVRSNSGLIVLQGELDRFTSGAIPVNRETAHLVATAFVRRQRLAFTGPVRDRAEDFLLASARSRIPPPPPPNSISAAVNVNIGDPYKDWTDLVRRHERIAVKLKGALRDAWNATAVTVGWQSLAQTINTVKSLEGDVYLHSDGSIVAAAPLGTDIFGNNVDLVSDRGHHRNGRLTNRARDDLLVERPQILERASAAADEHHVMHVPARQMPQRGRDLARR